MRQTTVLLMLVLCSTLVLAQSQETALRATVSYNADGSATLNEMSVTLAGIDQQTDRPLPDGVQLVLDNSVVYALPAPVSFRLLDAFVPLSSYTRTFRLPYFGNRGVLRVIRNNQSVFEFDLKRLCDNNGICGAYENGISCPADCDIGHKDIVCLPYEDGICDPDCAANKDPDCKVITQNVTETTIVKKEEASDPTPMLLGIIAVLAVVAVAYAILSLRKDGVKKPTKKTKKKKAEDKKEHGSPSD